MKLLLVEDNVVLAERIERQLSKLYLVDVATNGKEALDKGQGDDYAVIVLDLGLPDMSGLEVCKHLRQEGVESAVLILTAENAMDMRVTLLDCGADDYMTKPFDAAELQARVAALARRYRLKPSSAPLTFSDVIVDKEKRTVSRAGVPIDLRRKEFDILEYMISNNGRVLTREMITQHAWNSDKSAWSSTVDVHIKHLRDKIDRPFKTPLIKTVYGLGYQVETPE